VLELYISQSQLSRHFTANNPVFMGVARLIAQTKSC